jgi:hypothetical protein
LLEDSLITDRRNLIDYNASVVTQLHNPNVIAMSQVENPSYGVYALLNNTVVDRNTHHTKQYSNRDEEDISLKGGGVNNTNDTQGSESNH